MTISRSSQPEGLEGLDESLQSVAQATPVLDILLYLSWLRGVGMIGRALADKFPDEASWMDLLQDAEFMESLNEYATIIHEMRSLSLVQGGFDMEKLAQAVENHHGRALDAVIPVSERLGVSPVDLTSVLANA